MKFVLIALANHADAQGFAWPSIAHISETTEQDRKTVVAALATLRESGFLIDTGDKKGGTKQVTVYQLPVGKDVVNSAENGTVKESRKRNSTENGTVPEMTGNSTVFPHKQYRKRDTEPSGTIKEPSIKPVEKKSRTLPDDFGVSERVREWAAGKGHNRLAEHLEYFIGYAKANGKKYLDWDEAFMNAIRGNWAKLSNLPTGATGTQRPVSADWMRDDTALQRKGAEIGVQPRAGEDWPAFRSRVVERVNQMARMQ